MFPLDSLTCYDHPNKVRLGRGCDAGYVIADGMDYDVLISCGIGRDDSFEHDFLAQHRELHCFAFDGTVEQLPNAHSRMYFIKKNVGMVDTPSATNLAALISAYDDIFLKIDIEGGEYPWLRGLSDDQLGKFKQIAIEFHDPFESHKWSCLDRLRETHYLVHLHGNNFRPLQPVLGPYGPVGVPVVFECTYIRKRDLEMVPELNRSAIPGPLDYPCCPQVPDHVLDKWPFVSKGEIQQFG